MFLGAFMNFIFPLFGINNPLSSICIFISFSALTAILSILSYLRDSDFSEPEFIVLNDLGLPLIFLCTIPFLAIFGTYLINYVGINVYFNNNVYVNW